MKRLVLVFALSGTLLAAETVNFDSARVGAVPDGWTATMTHTGGSPKWEVMKDSTAPSQPNVLAQTTSDRTNGRYPLAIYNKVSGTNGKLSMEFKPISGEVDASGGLVWRYRDENNYYVVRANALEDNVVLYKVEKGRRSSLAPKGTATKTYGVKHTIPAKIWSTLGVTFEGNLFTVYYNGEKLFQVEDSTFTGAGKTGLWTKADSVTHFDNFQVDVK